MLFYASVICLASFGQLNAEPAKWSIGVATVDITPDYPVRLNGFGFRREESTEVRQHIFAKALVLDSDKSDPAILMTVDTLGIPADLVDRLAKRLNQKANISRDRIAITATHTHSAPMVNGVTPTIFGTPIPEPHQKHIDQYSKDFEVKLEQLALKALAERRPGTLSWGVGQVQFAQNRRAQGGPVDHDLPTLVVREPDGTLRAIYVSYACHCTTLSDNRIGGDWAGYAQERIEREHPGCTALVSIGCGADQKPSSGVVGDRADVAEKQGIEIAHEVGRLLKGSLAPIEASLTVQEERIALNLAALPSREEWQKRAELQNPVGHHARTMLAKLDRGEKLATQIEYSIQSWTFGDNLALVFLPGEVVVDYAKRLKEELDGSRLWINSYANGSPGYVPSERVLREGGYEGGSAMTYYGIPGPYAPGLENQIVQTVKKQIPKTYASSAAETQGSLPSSPEKTVASFQLKPGLVAEVVAAEPLISSPVAIDFDPQGRLWVAEMYDYPSGVDNQFTPGGRIKTLTDTDRDGHYDKATLFLEDIPFPTGVTVWRDGVLVCAAPDILFARDTDGDGKADEVRRLFTGFATQNYQARVNSLEYGLDGWVYGACGLFGGEIVCLTNKNKTVSIGQQDFRINPDAGSIEPAGGRTQQGRAKDDWGNWFGCTNSSLALHFPLEERYLSRNPFVHPPSAVRPIVSGPDAARLYPVSDLVRFKLTGAAGTATAACGLGIYRDQLLGGEYRGNLFVCEPVNNLVHRRVLKPDGASFKSFRAQDESQKEFLASTDKWFRPVQVRTGPDGALWVVDMYRYVIEHPTWIPPETLEKLNVRAGANRGRIYRISRKDAPPRPIDDLSKLTAQELALRLKSPNGPLRDLVQQMLFWKQETSAKQTLKDLASHPGQPETRIHALHTLHLLEQLDAKTLIDALNDENRHVRRHALRIAEAHLDERGIGEAILNCKTETLPLRIQLASTLGEWNDPRAASRIAQLALVSDESPYLSAAVLSSLHSQNVGSVMQAVLTAPTASESLISQLLEQTASLGQPKSIQEVLLALAKVPDSPRTFARVARMFDSLSRRLRAEKDLLDGTSREAMKRVLLAARRHASGSDPVEDRILAIRVISRLSNETEKDARLLAKLLTPNQPPAMQKAAVSELSKLGSQNVPELLIETWPSLTADLRSRIVESLLARSSWSSALLEAIRDNKIAAHELDLVSRQRLLEHPTASIRESAQSLLSAQNRRENREEVVARFRNELRTDGNATIGRDVFRKRCAACHRLEDSGNAVGPDLSHYATKPTDALLIAMFDPNQSVDPRYQSYAVALKDGRVLNGILAEETSNSLTLLNAEGKRQSLLRIEIDQLKNSARSLMPEGFERDLTPQDVTHLVAYFRSQRAAPKQIAGNTPELVRGLKGGTILLPATKAEIYGDEITFEPHFKNIGYWHSENDFLRWELESMDAGEWDVWLDWACADASAGNAFELQLADKKIQHQVLATGGWDQYRQMNIGRVSLPKGRSEILLRPAKPVQGALLDLKSLKLVPAGEKPDFEIKAPPMRPLPEDPASIARFLIADTNPTEQREALISKHPEIADKLITVLTAGFAAGTPEEYRRIPWIWRIAIAVGKRNQEEELRSVLQVAAPRPFEPMRDWQAVVIGGGLINGVSQAGEWPQARFAAVLKADPVLQKRWNRAIDLAFGMADDERIKAGTRYDALRMVAMAPWDRCRPLLKKYLASDVPAELQMGAVSGLVDVPDSAAGKLLVEAIPTLQKRNRDLALDGLLKSRARIEFLLDALENSRIPLDQLGKDRLNLLRNHGNAAIRNRAAALAN